VPSFWKTCYDNAKAGLPWSAPEDTIKNRAGTFASKMIGRWWDGTPLCFTEPKTGLYYPPTKENWAKVDSADAIKEEGEKNGFLFNQKEESWKRKEGGDTETYPGDPNGDLCPFAGHIRKVNPRDEFTDIGGSQRTLTHRIIRRGNNYGPRVDDVFNPTEDEKNAKRGLSLVMYQSSIEQQFEFLQRHWANSETRPKAGGDDMIIGLPANREKSIEFSVESQPVKICASPFTQPVGMGYFLLPPIDAIKAVLTSPVIDKKVFYDPPAGNFDFVDYKTRRLWDWTVDTVYWQSIWASANNLQVANGGQSAIPGFNTYPTGIAYRLPEYENTAKNYGPPFRNQTNLQFRSTSDIKAMAQVLASAKSMDSPDDVIVKQIIAWQGFPKRILDLYLNSDVNPYEIVEEVGWPPKDLTYRNYINNDVARQQDEYCEWFTHRNDDGKITRIDITCESPEYWTFLVKHRPDVAVTLYQKYVSPLVTLDSLLDNEGNYDPYNKWNTEFGAMHLNCPPNALFAEIYIAAEAATRWSSTCDADSCGPPLTEGGDLIGCATYGLSTRASDPTIGKNINDLIRNGFIISVDNPVGLYLEKLDTTGKQKSGGYGDASNC
jgi:hypothetical protein